MYTCQCAISFINIFINPKSTWNCQHVHEPNTSPSSLPQLPKGNLLSGLKVNAKKRIDLHRQSVSATGGGTGTPDLSSFDERMTSIVSCQYGNREGG